MNAGMAAEPEMPPLRADSALRTEEEAAQIANVQLWQPDIQASTMADR